MESYVALLRGINVSGQKSMKMQDLRSLLAKNGFLNVQTYVQSGNVIFTMDEESSPFLPEERIEKLIQEKYGFRVRVFVKTSEEIQYILRNNPFLNPADARNNEVNPGSLYVSFLSKKPEDEHFAITENKYLPDSFIIDEKIIYLHCPGGYGKTKLNNTFFEKKLKLDATTRNWKTLTKLAEISASGR